ncbi:MAG: CCA tRNA nucleotidyltransferase, partial [Candidatus Tritonobacter lacicola]|nr:CCA tRNA nucleotidyltransferase [Candidatus Tritonobacter lacicola]
MDRKSTCARSRAVAVVRKLTENGHKAYFVGGCVRDQLLGKDPGEYDIATSALPDDIRAIFSRTKEVGASFGVVLVIGDTGPCEVATFRRESGYADGRHPDTVVYTDNEEEDVKRRDFTINGLFYNPMEEKVIDFVGGRDDIKAKLIRCIGAPLERFGEDRLRILRAVRFAANLGFDIEKGTWEAVKEMASEIDVISAERVRNELVLMFTGPHPGRGLELLDASGLLEEILPEVAAMKGVAQPEQFHPEGDVFEHTKMMMDMLSNPGPILAFSTLLHDVGKPPTMTVEDRIRFNRHDAVGAEMTGVIMRRLRFSGEETRKVTGCVANHMRFRHVVEMRESKVRRLIAGETFEDELELHRMDCVASHGNLENWLYLKERCESMPEEKVLPPPLINGHDLLNMGYEKGPILGTILRAIEEAQLEGQISSREDALRLVREKFG